MLSYIQLQKQKPPKLSTLKTGWGFVCLFKFLSIYLRSVEAPAQVEMQLAAFFISFSYQVRTHLAKFPIVG